MLAATGARVRVQRAAAVLGAFLVVISPWLIRDAVVFHQFVPITTEGGFTAAGQYNALAGQDDAFEDVPAPMRFDGHAEALAWLTAERSSIVHAVMRAEAAGGEEEDEERQAEAGHRWPSVRVSGTIAFFPGIEGADANISPRPRQARGQRLFQAAEVPGGLLLRFAFKVTEDDRHAILLR